MSPSIIYFKYKINLFLYAASVSIVVRPPAACRRFSPSQGDRRLAAKPVMVLIILSTINQPFSESCGLDESKRIILKVFLSVPALLPVFSGSDGFYLKDIVLIG